MRSVLLSKNQTTSFWRKRKRKTLGRLRLAANRHVTGLGELRAEQSSCSLNQDQLVTVFPEPAGSPDPCELRVASHRRQ